MKLPFHEFSFFKATAPKACNKIFLPAFVNRFRKDIIKFGKLAHLCGNVKEIEVSWIRKSGIPRPSTWITNREKAGGGVLIDIGTHVIDIGLMFVLDKSIKSASLLHGNVDEVQKKRAQWNVNDEGQKLLFDVETWARGEIVFSDDSILKIHVNWSADVSEDTTKIKVIGTNGTISINTLFGFSNNFTRDNIEILYYTKNEKREAYTFPMDNDFAMKAFRDLIKYFIALINGKNTNFLQTSDAIYTVDVIEKLYISRKGE